MKVFAFDTQKFDCYKDNLVYLSVQEIDQF